MCTLYSNTKARELVRALFRISPNRAATYETRNAILPSETAPVVRLADDGERELVNLSWGFVRIEPARAPRRVVNTRDDQVRSNPFWRSSFAARRCLVPATSYSEPHGVKPATWHWFALNPERPMFAFPGLWRTYKGSVKKDGPSVEMDVYSIDDDGAERADGGDQPRAHARAADERMTPSTHGSTARSTKLSPSAVPIPPTPCATSVLDWRGGTSPTPTGRLCRGRFCCNAA